jgi:hypothetical protein
MYVSFILILLLVQVTSKSELAVVSFIDVRLLGTVLDVDWFSGVKVMCG